MDESPRIRRLRQDHREIREAIAQSTILRGQAKGPYRGAPPDHYQLEFHGKGIEAIGRDGTIVWRHVHKVSVVLGRDYPRRQPEIEWQTPIFHPNIAENGMVCLGAAGWYWRPSLALVDLCSMLWDMIRYANFDSTSPLNMEAAQWVSGRRLAFPLDARTLKDRIQRQEDTRLVVRLAHQVPGHPPVSLPGVATVTQRVMDSGPNSDVLFID